MPDEKLDEDIKKIKYVRIEDFVSGYANNVFFETSVFDIKMTFGELVQPLGGEAFIEQRSAMTISWLQAKIAALFLSINVATHEKRFGTISIPDGILPANFQRTPEEGKLPLTKLTGLIEERAPVKPDSPVSETTQ